MKTTLEHQKNELRKQLFHALFQIQYELERSADLSDLNVQLTIEMIDLLLEIILHSVDDH